MYLKYNSLFFFMLGYIERKLRLFYRIHQYTSLCDAVFVVACGRLVPDPTNTVVMDL